VYNEAEWREFLESVGLSEEDAPELIFDDGETIEEKLRQSQDKEKLAILLLRQFWMETQLIKASHSEIIERIERIEQEVKIGVSERGQLKSLNRQQRKRANKIFVLVCLVFIAGLAEFFANLNQDYAPWFMRFLDVESVRKTMTAIATGAIFAAIGIITGKPGDKASQFLSIDVVLPLESLWRKIRRR
jgi:hypothetical protein